jgi:PhnB protein
MPRKKSKTSLKKVTLKKTTPRKKKVAPIPKGYHAVTPYLFVDGAVEAIAFYKKAFKAKVEKQMRQPDGRISHAELLIGDSKVMLADEFPEMNARAPKTYGGSPVCIHLYVEDVDKVVKRAVTAGAQLKKAVENTFYGDRAGSLEDPFGHHWYIASHVEDLTPREIKKRAAQVFGK